MGNAWRFGERGPPEKGIPCRELDVPRPSGEGQVQSKIWGKKKKMNSNNNY